MQTRWKSRSVNLALTMAGLVLTASAASAQMRTGEQMKGYAETLGVVLNQRSYQYSMVLLRSSAAGNILYPGEQPTFVLQVQNNQDRAVKATGKVDLIAYGTRGIPGDIWMPDMYRIGDVGSVPIAVEMAAKGFANVTVSPKVPDRLGAYALVVDLGEGLGRRFATSFIRTFAAGPRRLQYPSMSLDHLPHDVLRRLGI